ncbi:MAG TPA: NADH-quinone oxidoreductase subunit N [Thermodesulfobacteriota bacterium]|nr:NADH-quinone oxidoreductase subunit N [Thermodesulfobacteriota bacterium]
MDLSEVLKSTLLIGPEIALIVTGILLIVIDPLVKGDAKKELFWIALAGLVIGFVLNFNRFQETTTAFSGALSLDGFSAYFNVIFILGAILALVLSRDYIENMHLRVNEYYGLLLFSTSGMMLLSSAKEFMSLFLAFEIMSISVYILSGFNRASARSAESGIKYLVLGGFSSAILLYGIALIYGASGTIFLDEIAARFDANNPLYLAGTALILTGFIFKIGAFPLHQWVPDIYEGAPMTVTGFMSVGVKAAAFAILLRVLFEGFSEIQANWIQVLWVVSAFTMTIGNLAAIVQRSIKRMLAYSSIAHAGYALVGVVAAYGGKELALSSVLYYLFAYTFMNLGAFGVLAYLSRNGKECETYEDISGLWERKPLTAIALGIFMFSLAGIPPTIGFFAKYRVFLAGVSAKFYWLVVIAVLNSVVSAYYYLRVLVYAYMREETVEFPSFKPASAVALTILTIATLILGIFPFYSWDLALKAADSFLLAFQGK